jgi:hypothetical protein
MRRPLVIYDFASDPFRIFLHMRKFLRSFLSVFQLFLDTVSREESQIRRLQKMCVPSFLRCSVLLEAIQRWNSWTAFIVDVTGHKLEYFQTRVSVWFSTLIFPFYKMLFINRLKFSCVADFFVRMFKTREDYGFL